jgi:predicted ABC-type ATPase
VSTPVLHVLAGPNGAGKSTFVDRILLPSTGLSFVNADENAPREWPGDPTGHGYEASRLAAAERSRLLGARTSFVTETVFSHPSKVELVRRAAAYGYLVNLHVILVPVELSVARVSERVRRGGHAVPGDKIRQRHARVWALVARAVDDADRTVFYDNSRAARPFREVARYEAGRLVEEAPWPAWTPAELRALGGGGS